MLEFVSINHIYRENNKRADELANLALDSAICFGTLGFQFLFLDMFIKIMARSPVFSWRSITSRFC